ncbi:biotin-dependent carboxyltransferase family protein [Gymnodinialimonas hymeniacidonis]|uniref:5-oxoprolinase subunit C family protein n=1 Tax=Gymnodinialimonas hymeniacidonis TaxID=3126508 RepID=UPI0034C6CF84
MSIARLKVIAAGPLVSFQDAGRPGLMRYGVPASGPMDRFAFDAAHAMLGNLQGGTSIEVSLGGLVLECIEGAVSVAVAGGSFRIGLNGAVSEGWMVHSLTQGARISINGGAWGSWCYLAFAGDVAAPEWLSSKATHTLSGLGGGAVQSGDIITIDDASLRPGRNGLYDVPDIAHPDGVGRVVIGPQDARFVDGTTDLLCETPYRVTDAYNRMGMRLDGPTLELGDALSIPSEPIVRGSIQVAGDGVPTLLLADHQTTGGYPKIATMISADVDRATQLRAGEPLKFQAVSATEAVAITRAHADARKAALDTLAAPRQTLVEKLREANLISGAVAEK